MNTALALATRDQRAKNSFNLRVGRFTKKRKYDELKQELGRVGVYALIAIVALTGSFFAEYYVLKKRHDNYEKEIMQIFKKTLPEVTRIVNPVQQLKVAVNNTKGAMLLPQLSAGRGATIELLRDIFINIPKSVPLDLDRLTIDEQRVRLRGNTDTFNSVDKIKGGLGQSSYFTSVSIASAQLDRGGNTIRFELLMEQP
jgi:type II secretory pathway component PulL